MKLEMGAMRNVDIKTGKLMLEGVVSIPAGEANGIVIFVGQNKGEDQRERCLMRMMAQAQLGTLRIDGLPALYRETLGDAAQSTQVPSEVIVSELVGATDWLQKTEETKNLRVGYFSAAEHAGATLQAAGNRSDVIRAVVIEDGRFDLSKLDSYQCIAPTLFLVRAEKRAGIRNIEQVMRQLRGDKRLHMISSFGAELDDAKMTERVMSLARNWFDFYLGPLS